MSIRKEQRYDAFISYSHNSDAIFAKTLQREVERCAKPWYRVRSLRLFRDETNLSPNPDLWRGIEQALLKSDWLILLASPAAAVSEWVAKEIDWWKTNEEKDNNRIILVLTDGQLVWDDIVQRFDTEKSTALPACLFDVYSIQPLWVDCRWSHKEDAIHISSSKMPEAAAGIAASISGLDKDEVAGEAVRQHRIIRRLTIFTLLLLFSMLTIAILFGLNALRQGNLAREQLRLSQSHQMAAKAILQANSNPRLAAAYALASRLLEDSDESRNAALYVVENNRYVVSTAVISSVPIRDISTDGNIIMVSDDSRDVAVLEYPSLKRLGVIKTDDEAALHAYTFYTIGNTIYRYFIIVDGNRLKFYSAQNGDIPAYEKSFELDFETDNHTDAYIDGHGGVLILSSHMEGFYWSPILQEEFRFTLRDSGTYFNDKSLYAASGFSVGIAEPGKAGSVLHEGGRALYVALNTGEVFRLHLDMMGGTTDGRKDAWLEYAFRSRLDAEIHSMGWVPNSAGNSLLVSTDVGLSKYDYDYSGYLYESAYPYAGIVGRAVEFASLYRDETVTAILTETGITLTSNDIVSPISGSALSSFGEDTSITALTAADNRVWIAGRSNGSINIIDPFAKPLSLSEIQIRASASGVAADGTFLLSTGLQQQYADGIVRYMPEEGENEYRMKQVAYYGMGSEMLRDGVYINDADGDGQNIVAGGKLLGPFGSGFVALWRGPSHEPDLVLDFSADADRDQEYDIVTTVVFAPDLNRIAAYNLSQGAVAIWSSETGERLHTIQVMTDPSWTLGGGINIMSSSRDGKTLLVTSGERTLIIDMLTGESKLIELPSGMTWLSPDGTKIAREYNRRIFILDLVENVERVIDNTFNESEVAWSSDGKTIAVSSTNNDYKSGSIYFYDTDTFSLIGLPIQNPSGFLIAHMYWLDNDSKLMLANAKWIHEASGTGHYEMKGIDIVELPGSTFESQLLALIGEGITDTEWNDVHSMGIELPDLCRSPQLYLK